MVDPNTVQHSNCTGAIKWECNINTALARNMQYVNNATETNKQTNKQNTEVHTKATCGGVQLNTAISITSAGVSKKTTRMNVRVCVHANTHTQW